MKYKVGDRVRIKSLDWYNENKDEYGNIDINHDFTFYADRRKYCGKVVTISEVFDIGYSVKEDNDEYYWTDEMIECKMEEVNTLKIQSNDMETETHKGYCTTDVETTNESKKVAWFTFWDNDFADKVELDLSNRELIQEDGKWFVVKKKKEYPKTFEECVHVLEGENRMSLELMNTFRKLIDARNAYWKIAGEEMGLGKPWEPDWTSGKPFYCISVNGNIINKGKWYIDNKILAFPTEEMRDAFKENFNKELEICKELL